ncbi:OsmC family protein [Pseudonocardia hispaniensis]|uniref:OsmC family protein n=1 Tax=Pseudonocardia hispaniensis TaxID=904933 RepID=A0ABW1IZC7_9PSEU
MSDDDMAGIGSLVHRYRATSTWSGSTGAGYREYDRAHSGAAPPAKADLRLSADPAFGGDSGLLNPEQLVVLAASSCQLLSFLAVAARARLDVRDYRDEAEASMPEADRPIRLAEIVLRPHIFLAEGPTEEQVRHLVEVAHRECFIANSLTTPVRVEPVITFVPA